MLKQRPVIYVALLAVLGGLWLAGVSIDVLLPIGFVALMFLMHMGGHGHGGHGHAGHGGHESSPPEQEPTADRPAGEHSEHRGRSRFLQGTSTGSASKTSSTKARLEPEETEEVMSNERLVVKDPVCGMSVDAATAALSIDHGGQTFSFCSQHCADAFAADPDKYVSTK